ncbi:YlzJ-like family protein [Bacillus spongiae]|uniref:YlzJ-like family protein n=1 Tax=Bacillus spongiae TaxID=2683610 RepID=A0ABU8HAA1_9BACI
MILHTTVPYELIFPTAINLYDEQKMVTFNGIPVIVQQDQQGYRVVRVLSSDPQHYMNDSITPGQYLSDFI